MAAEGCGRIQDVVYAKYGDKAEGIDMNRNVIFY